MIKVILGIVTQKAKETTMRKITLRQLVTVMPNDQVMTNWVIQAETQTTAMINPIMAIIAKGQTQIMSLITILRCHHRRLRRLQLAFEGWMEYNRMAWIRWTHYERAGHSTRRVGSTRFD